VLLCCDWTLLRLFPPLRATWARKGTQATVPITGANAKRVLFRGGWPNSDRAISGESA
jgi:hypothetical protein